MALEGITLNEGSGGQRLATDTVGGFDFQIIKIGVGADDAMPVSVGATNPMPVDVLSLVPGTGAANLGKAADAMAGATDTGVPPLAIRDDVLTALTPADGDYVPLRVNSTGALHVTGGGGGTEYNEDDATPAPIVGSATLIERDDALTVVAPVEGDWIGLRGTAEGALWVQDFNSDQIRTDGTTIAGAVSGTEMQVDIVAPLPAGTNTIGKLAANSGVDIGDVDVLSVIPGVSATSLGKAEDAIHASGDTGVMGLAVRKATPVNLSSVDGDYEPFQIDAGRLWVSAKIDTALPAGANNIGDVDVLTLPANASINLNQIAGSAVVTGGATGSQGVGGLAANGAAVVGSPVLVGGSDGTNAQTILVSASGKQCFMSSSAASDGSSNSIASPVVSATLSFKQAISNFVFNGTTWDRLRGDTSGLHVSAQPARVSTTDTITAKLATDAIMDGITSLTPKRALIVATASGDTVVVAGVGGKKIRVLSLFINAFGDADVEFQDTATVTSRSGLIGMGTSSGKAKGLVLAFSPVGHFETAVGVGLDINLSAAVTVEGHLVYVEV